MQLSTSQAFHLNRAGLERADLQQKALGREARLVNMTELGAALTTLDDPPVKALVVYNSNPAAIAPNQNAVLAGLRREDLFTVVLEQFQNDTADYADILLPCHHLPGTHRSLPRLRPLLSATGAARAAGSGRGEIECRGVPPAGADAWASTTRCFQDSEDDMIRTLLDSAHPFVKGITLEELEREHFVRLRIPQPFLPFAEGGFGTPDGKCHFHAETLDYTPPVESRHGDGELRAQVSAGADLAEKRRQHELHLRPSRRGGPRNRHAASQRRRCRARGHSR